MIEEAPTKELKFLLAGEEARTKELTKLGVRESKEMILYVTYTDTGGATGQADWIDRALLKIEKFWVGFQGQAPETEATEYKKLFADAFFNGFRAWEETLMSRWNLQVEALNEVELWAQLWKRFNRSSPIPVPQVINFDGKNLDEEVRTPVDASTLLIADSVPKLDRQWVHVKDRYVGCLTFWDKPGGWKDEVTQLRYLWRVIARDDIADTEVFCEISPANQMLVKTAMQRMTKQSIVQASKSKTSESYDVVAEINAERTITAQKELYQGSAPFYTAVTFLVHRQDKDSLNEACQKIENCFQRPAWIVRETDMTGKIWLQTLPIVQEKMLVSKLGDRRFCYLDSEVPGLMPLVMTQPVDRQGIELIAEDGGMPIWLDLFDPNEPKNLALFATTRAGKSVLVSDLLKHALARGMPVVAIDFPKPDGTSTFTDFTQFMGKRYGAYFDISRESNNLFEKPDLRSLSVKEQEDRFNGYRDFLEGALLALVIGQGTEINPLLKQTIQSLLGLALNAFFYDSHIQKRYEVALEGGFGTGVWQEMPTMKDYIKFCSLDRLDLNAFAGVTSMINEALQQIQLRLRYWLGSRVGRAISHPSSFPADAQLLVFALTNLSNEEEAAILSLSAYSAALRRALSAPASIFFIDEAPILFEFEEIAALVSRLCANGGKAGVRTIISAQDPDTIAKSKYAAKIFQNLSLRLIGRIQTAAVKSFERILQYPVEVITRNVYYKPNKKEFYTRWLLDNGGTFTECRFYPAYIQLGITANNPAEQAARSLFLKRYPDKYEAIARFTLHLIACFRNDQPLNVSLPESEPEVPLALTSTHATRKNR